jgi:hypothetical protein
MKIRITGKGLPKAQWLNSQPGEELKPSSQPNYNWTSFETPTPPAPQGFAQPQIKVVEQEGTPVQNTSPIVPIKQYKPGEWMNANQSKADYWLNKALENKGVKAAASTGKKAQTVGAVLSPILGMIDNKVKSNEMEAAWRQSLFSTGPVNTTVNRGDYEQNTGMVDPYNTGAKSKGQFTNMFYPTQFQTGGPISFSDEPVRRNLESYIPEVFTQPVDNTYVKAPRTDYNFKPRSSDTTFKDLIAERESKGRGGYKAEAKDKNGKLVSSAAGKYQFLWDTHKGWISKITGVTSKQQFLNSPDAQEIAMDYWDQTVLTPNAVKIKEQLGVPDSIDQIKARIHFAGPKGAYDYYATGHETKDAFGTTTSTYVKQMGGETFDDMKIKITQEPMDNMAYGGQLGYGFDLGGRRIYTDQPEGKQDGVATTMGPVPREEANIEAERGEVYVGDVNDDGMDEHMVIGGKRHSQGGTPLNVDKGFIFSDTKKMKIKDPEILKAFGKSYKAGGYTPAEIAKQYDLNKYKAMLEDPYADSLTKNTAQRMLDSYNKKLGLLAFTQESKKGFPQGLPDLAQSAMPQMSGMPQAKYGGYFYDDGGPTSTEEKEKVLTDKYPWLKPWLKSNTKEGRTSPTGRITTYNKTVDNLYKDIDEWEKIAGRKFNNLQDLQGFVYSSLEQSDPSVTQGMWNDWGHTAKSKTTDIGNFVDGIMGARTAKMLTLRPKTPDKPVVPVTTTPPPVINTPPVSDVPEPPTKPGVPNVPQYTPGKSNVPYGWTQQDINNLALAAYNLGDIKKYGSVRRDVNPVLGDFRNMDWRGKAAELQGTYNSQINTLGAYGSPQSLAANASFMAGQQAENLINRAIEPTEQQNVQIYNQVANQNAGIMNQALVNNAQNQFLRSQDRAVLNQQYDNARRDARKAFTMATNQGLTNASGIYNTNITESPYYYFDPRTQKMQFNSPAAKAAFESSIRNATPNDGNIAAKAAQVYRSLSGLPDEQKNEFMKHWYGSQFGIRGTSTSYPNNPKNNKTVVPMGYTPATPWDN